jgi:hypothetical protein
VKEDEMEYLLLSLSPLKLEEERHLPDPNSSTGSICLSRNRIKIYLHTPKAYRKLSSALQGFTEFQEAHFFNSFSVSYLYQYL